MYVDTRNRRINIIRNIYAYRSACDARSVRPKLAKDNDTSSNMTAPTIKPASA